MNNEIINTLIIYSADEGKLKILLKKNQDEPYKGYWILPNKKLISNTSIEKNLKSIFKEATNIECDKFVQGKIYDEKTSSGTSLTITNICITDKDIVNYKKKEDYDWFDVDNLPKIGFNHKTIINDSKQEMKEKIIYNFSNILLDIFKSDFTLSELQKFYENILDKKIDRRNFRKKVITQKLVIDTGEKTKSSAGRPGKLYIFNKDNMEGKIIWTKKVGD